MIRTFGGGSKADVENEIQVIADILGCGEHKNIIIILQHGPLLSSDYYFIDMELCDIYLGYISKIERKAGVVALPVPSKNLAFVHRPCSAHQKLLNIWTIMSHIAEGLKFMHENTLVHRDLNPRNCGVLL